MVKIGSGTILGLIMALIFLTILLSVAKTTIPTAAASYYDLSQAYSNTTVFGEAASSFAASTPSYMGWFWVIGPFALVIMLIMGLFKGRR